jgi:hypothetical protein
MTFAQVDMTAEDTRERDSFIDSFNNISVTNYGPDNYKQAKLNEELAINLSNIDGECADHSVKFMWWQQVANKAKKDFKIKEQFVKSTKAKLFKIAKTDNGIKREDSTAKVTDEYVKNWVEDHVLYKNAVEELIVAEYVYDTYAAMVESLRSRGTLLNALRKKGA